MSSTKESASIGVAPCLTGTDISCRFFWEVGLSAVEARFPEHINRIAAGFVSAASAVPISRPERNCSFPSFQIFLTDPDFAEIGPQLQTVLDHLPADFCGLHRDRVNGAGSVFSVERFFKEKTSSGSFDGVSCAPENAADWLMVPEHSLFDITQAQVFYDPLGEFSKRRQSFATYYPDDVWRMRTATSLRECGESGQVLLARSLSNGDFFTSQVAWWQFSEAVMRLGFLLNRRYAPAREMIYREFCKLPELAFDVVNWLWDGQCETTQRMELVSLIASTYEAKLINLGLSRPSGDPESFLIHAKNVSAAIVDPQIRALDC